MGTDNFELNLYVKSHFQDDMDRPKSKVEIPALAAGTSNNGRMSKENTIKAIEAKLKALENQADDLVINQLPDGVPLIQKYQYNKNNGGGIGTSGSSSNSRKFNSRPYQRNQQRRPRR